MVQGVELTKDDVSINFFHLSGIKFGLYSFHLGMLTLPLLRNNFI
jgi:hypothetical protein